MSGHTHSGVEAQHVYTIAGRLTQYRAYCESCDYRGTWCIAPDIPEASIRAHMRNEHGSSAASREQDGQTL